ncbi:MAG TPA: hypothetical protein VN853_08680 [Polyangia bacterium]|jgi:hypothetical protein|nr:hypothetical protein [Polyangia bacterium]
MSTPGAIEDVPHARPNADGPRPVARPTRRRASFGAAALSLAIAAGCSASMPAGGGAAGVTGSGGGGSSGTGGGTGGAPGAGGSPTGGEGGSAVVISVDAGMDAALPSCAPNQLFCQGRSLRRCTADGMNSTLDVTCATTQYCDGATASCQTQLCQPTQPGCDGTVATTCNADGSGYAGTRTDCAATSLLCSQGSCLPAACTAGARYCDGDAVRSCASNGLGSTLVSTCGTGSFCDPSTATCQQQVCSPGQAICDGNKTATCNANGSGNTGVETDCSANGMICGGGSCSTSVTDTVGTISAAGDGTSDYNIYGLDFYAVTASRTLKQITQYADISFGGETVTFMVYSSSTQIGTYTLVATSPGYFSSQTLGYVSSGPVSVPLVAGKFYAIGMLCAGNYSLTTFTNDTAWGSSFRPTVSFGTMFDGQGADGQTVAPTSITYNNTPRSTVAFYLQELTTGP